MEWISVKDRLPNKVYVLCCNSNSLPFIACFGVWGNYWACSGERTNVTHWMPLPEPPKEKN